MTVSLLSGSTPVILIVDDDEVIRMLMRQFLEGEGYVVVEAEDGHSALDRVAEQSFDLVILDIAMPGIDGPEVCEQIRTTMTDSPPVLMVTALDDEKSIERSYAAGARSEERRVGKECTSWPGRWIISVSPCAGRC
jgi:CheY-like chemotaxis protein